MEVYKISVELKLHCSESVAFSLPAVLVKLEQCWAIFDGTHELVLKPTQEHEAQEDQITFNQEQDGNASRVRWKASAEQLQPTV